MSDCIQYEPKIKDDYLRRVLKGEEFLLFDGAMGTMLQSAGLEAGDLPELLNLSDPAKITEIHKAYVDAGAQVVTSNTFGASAHKLGGHASVAEVFGSAISCAKNSDAVYVAADIGPIGSLMKPLGPLSFDEAYHQFKEQVIAAQQYGADLILIETMSNLLEAKAAILAAKENTDLPIFATMTFEEDGRTFLGTDPQIAAITLSALGVAALGINCSLDPIALLPFVKQLVPYAKCPVMVQANAGLPSLNSDLSKAYAISPQQYAEAVVELIEEGVSIIGGCCGTDPSFITELARAIEGKRLAKHAEGDYFSVTSAHTAVVLPIDQQRIAVIGERINPTGKPRLKRALLEENYDYLAEQAIEQQKAGADILDVNVGIAEIDEVAVLAHATETIQAITRLPLQIDSSDPAAIEAAVRGYAGKPLINSVNGKQESLDAILPIAKHYGCAILGLTLDDQGIPKTAEQRLAIARRIVDAAEACGVPRCDVIIDCLVMAAATNQADIKEILKAITLVKQELGVKTVLGVSNVSFGLPERELVNATFLATAFGVGLDLPILDPLSMRYRDVVNSFKVLNAQDKDAQAFIAKYAHGDLSHQNEVPSTQSSSLSLEDETRAAILEGRSTQIAELTSRLLEKHKATEIIDQIFIPALNTVGEKFESGEYFLPQLMVSAEVVKQGFEIIKAKSAGESVADKGKICLATVKGDVHDIGKNIVKMLLENYGYRVFDLGADVDPSLIIETVRRNDISLVGLSALMTTTVRSMEETIRMLQDEIPKCAIFVGGAVLSSEYAKQIGADHYGKDAAEAVRIAESHFKNKG